MMRLTDMRLTKEEKADNMGMPCVFNQSEYPYGLSISLDEKTIEKLNVDHSDWQIGDVFDLRAMARVTSVSENESENGKTCRVELQIVMLGCESEDDEA